jgi:uncharacterized protein
MDSYLSFLAPLSGGILIGLSGAILLLLNGRVAGISGIVGGLVRPRPAEWGWRLLFALGLVAGGIVTCAVDRGAIGSMLAPPSVLAVAGLLVGFGTRLGRGCTSGHGVCGIARLSKRSIAATATFMAVAAAVVLLAHTGAGK